MFIRKGIFGVKQNVTCYLQVRNVQGRMVLSPTGVMQRHFARFVSDKAVTRNICRCFCKIESLTTASLEDPLRS